MISWTIVFSDGSTGFQVMDDDLSNAVITDEHGEVKTGNYEYVVVSNA